MTSEQTPEKGDRPEDRLHTGSSAEARLIHLDDSKPAGQKVRPAKDINNRITTLDADLAQLRAELSAINNSVEEGLDRLGDTDTDLTAKVSETYKRLGEIDNAYKSLLQISSRIDADIQKLNGDVSVVARQTATGIKNLEQSTVAQSSELARKNQQVASRLEQLVETSRLSSEVLKEKIQYVTDRIVQVEKNLLADIESLSRQSAKESERLDNSIEASRAKIIKLQSVDEAIIKRATTLEITAAELGMKSRQMEAAIDQLETSSNTLFTELSTLGNRVSALQQQNTEQSGQIEALNVETGRLRSGMARLAGTVDRHFKSLAGALALILMLSVALFFYQQSALQDTQQALDGRLAGQAAQQQAGLNDMERAISTIETKMEDAALTADSGLSVVASQLAGLRDRLDSIEGRFNNETPFSNIGDDNIIHGEHWLLQQPAGNYTVQLAVLDNRQAMYELAARYNHYLDQRLSSYTVMQNGRPVYVLLAGNYAQPRDAGELIDSLPASLLMEDATAVPLGRVQDVIQQQAAVNTL